MGSIGQTHWPNLRRPTCPIVLPAVLLSEFLSGLSEVASLEIPVRLAEEIVLPFCPVWVGRISTMPRPIFLVRLSIVRISNPTQVSSRHKSIGQRGIHLRSEAESGAMTGWHYVRIISNSPHAIPSPGNLSDCPAVGLIVFSLFSVDPFFHLLAC